MPDNIERILRDIHKLFAESEEYEGSESRIIVDKKRVFAMLERLNYAVMEVMDKYEVNERSKELAINKVQKEAQQIIDDASKSAEQIYAASIIYTDDALLELRDLVRKTQDNIDKEYKDIIGRIDKQVEMINKNKDELHAQLSELSGGNEYLNIIVEEQKRRGKDRDKYNKVENGETKDNTQSRLVQYANNHTASRNTDTLGDDRDNREITSNKPELVINVNTNHPAIKKMQEKELEAAAKELEANYDLDKEYFEWQDSENEDSKEADSSSKKGGLRAFFLKD